MESIEVPSDVLRKFKKFQENFEFANKNLERIQEHLGEYVAIGNGEILGFSEDKMALLRKFASVEGLFVSLITPSNINP